MGARCSAQAQLAQHEQRPRFLEGATMDIASSTALVTGANRGLGRALAAELLRRGAIVYAGARNPDSVDLPGVKAVRLDITDPARWPPPGHSSRSSRPTAVARS
jgi:NAD(P)-dependent dehydrogenase (short-subunit alcohol dehydrogenase family)